ncbi:vesicle transport protein SEC20-like [Thalassophryne amazonica]|uniref:vesicle transport protein SEC20-like n=1 Tax=Thalassophryne amazonica TaxID=390379 RepID=UPI00147259E3|nr:vesicle transport protein SEC20-like [Thalassophryne amazonica]
MEKQALLNNANSDVRQRKMTKEGMSQTASSITENLMSISRMMAQQVQQSEETMTTLATSSKTIQETSDEFKAMTGTIQLGRKLITKYNRRELTDKLLIFLALALFLATVLYILKKRLFLSSRLLAQCIQSTVSSNVSKSLNLHHTLPPAV